MTIIAVVAGLVATVLAFAYIRSSAAANEPEPLVAVLFVAADLPANHAIDPDTDLRPQPVGAISSAALARSAIKADELEAVRGRRISAPLPAGVPLMYAHLAAIQDIRIGPGKRAMTIDVGREGTLGGILVPGDHVDVIVTYEVRSHGTGAARDIGSAEPGAPEATLGAILARIARRSADPGHWEARQVLRDVRVIAVGSRLTMSRQQLGFRSSSGLPPPAGAVTLEVSPAEALELIQATAGGANPVTLLLRPNARRAAEGAGLVPDQEGP